MDKNDIIEYVMNTPHNTNRAVLSSMLNQLTEDSSDGSSDFNTVTVSIVNTNESANIDFYGIVDNSYAQALLKSNGDYLVGYSWTGETNITAEFLMIQNSFMIAVPMVEPTITGSATKEYLSEYSEWDVTVTGDCTITIS